MRTGQLLLLCAFLAGCAGANPDNMTTKDLWSDYCLSEGNEVNRVSGTTVDSWDPDATTAGHRGISSEDKLGPNPSTVKGC